MGEQTDSGDVCDALIDIVNVVRTNKGMAPLPALAPEMRLREDLGFDSLDMAELTARLHEKHRVDVFAAGLVFTVGEVEQRIRDGGDAQKSKGLNVGRAEPSPADAGSKGLNV